MNEEHPNTNASIMRDGFGSQELEVQHETAATAIAAAAKASIEARYILAMKRPRDWDNVMQRLKRECQRAGFADAAIYRKPVGKKFNDDTGKWEQAYVEGLSVRFAEAALRHVSNFYGSATSIYDDPNKSIVRVTVMDLESNATWETDVTVSKTVERKQLKKGQKPLAERVNSYGDRVFIVGATDDEVLNKSNALISKALRNGVLRLLPGDIQDDCEELCRKTQAKRDREDPDAAKRKLFDAFATLGIMPDELKRYLGSAGEVLQPAELAELRAIYSAIRDGETTWAAVMEAKHPEAAGSGDAQKPTGNAKQVDELLEKHKKKAADKKASKDAAPADPAQAETSPAQPTRDPAADSSGHPEPGANG